MIRISICIASYNGVPFIEKQLNSIIEQISDDDEIIISDDGSTDNTIKIIKGFNDPRIKLFNNYKGNNLIDNFKNALTKASGEYIFLSDQDDIWEPDKIDIMLYYLQQHDLVVSDCSIIDLNDNIIHDSFFKSSNSEKGLLKNIKKNNYMGCCMAFNRFILEKALPLPKKIPMHDWWIGLIAELFGNVFFCPEKLVKYRRHNTNCSPFVGQSKYSFLEQLNFRKNLIISLYKAWVSNSLLSKI